MRDIVDASEVLAETLSRLRTRFASLPRDYDDIRALAEELSEALKLETNSEMYMEAARLKHLFALWEDLVCEDLLATEETFDRYPPHMHGTGGIRALEEAVRVTSGWMLREFQPKYEEKDRRFSALFPRYEQGIRAGAPELVGTLERERGSHGPQVFYEMFSDIWDEHVRDNTADLYEGQRVLVITDVFIRPEDFSEIALNYTDEANVARLVNSAAIMPTYLIGHIVDAKAVAETLLDENENEVLAEPDTIVLAAHDPVLEYADIVLVEREKGHIAVERFVDLDHGDVSVGAILGTDLWKWK